MRLRCHHLYRVLQSDRFCFCPFFQSHRLLMCSAMSLPMVPRCLPRSMNTRKRRDTDAETSILHRWTRWPCSALKRTGLRCIFTLERKISPLSRVLSQSQRPSSPGMLTSHRRENDLSKTPLCFLGCQATAALTWRIRCMRWCFMRLINNFR